MSQLLLRFIVGGLFVSLFSFLGCLIKPKSLSGIFGAAPSISIASFVFIWAQEGAVIVKIQAFSMILGSVSLALYSWSCFWLIQREKCSPWIGTLLLWTQWICTAVLFERLLTP